MLFLIFIHFTGGVFFQPEKSDEIPLLVFKQSIYEPINLVHNISGCIELVAVEGEATKGSGKKYSFGIKNITSSGKIKDG